MRLRAQSVTALLIAVTVVRIAAAVWAAFSSTRGDYYASLPGAYVEQVNPTLWDSPDMAGAWGYHTNTYFHGPTQYLTLYPVAYFDTYADIAMVLLPIYAAILCVAFLLLRSTMARLTGSAMTAPLFAALFLFFPLLQAFIQREFEVVVFLALVTALWLLVGERRAAAGAVLGYIAWFKYVPLLFVGYLGLRRWYTAIAAFAIASAAMLLAADVLFGLELFVNNNVPRHAAQVFNLWSYGFEPGAHGYMYGTGFCYGWIEIETTLANVRHGLCSLAYTSPWFPPHVVYIALCATIAAFYLVAHFRFERDAASETGEPWRRALEFSVVTTVCTCFFFNHYYYLIALAIPLAVLLGRLLVSGNRTSFVLWGAAYLMLSAFVVPTSVLTRISGVEVWALYIKGAWFLWGELILIYLLLREYWDLSRRPTMQREMPATPAPLR